MDDTVTLLGDVEVLQPDGKAIRLGSTWAERPVFLALIRHFG